MKLRILLAIASALLWSVGAAGDAPAAKADPDVAALITNAAAAHEHLMRGDIARYRDALAFGPDFSLMDPFGGKPTPLPNSEAHWQRIGSLFRDGADARFEPLATYRSDSMIVLVANEHAKVAIGSLPAQNWSLRVTLVFRRDEGVWRLVHRHADPLANAISLEESGRLALGRS